MKKDKFLLLPLILYLILTTYFYIHSNERVIEERKMSLFFQDQQAAQKLNENFTYDSTDLLLLNRLVHNKVETALDTFITSLFRNIDMPFLFGISPSIATPYEREVPFRPFYLFELPFLIVSVFYFIKNYSTEERKLKIFLLFFFISFFIVGLISPHLHPIKIIPLQLTLRAFMLTGTYLFIKRYI